MGEAGEILEDIGDFISDLPGASAVIDVVETVSGKKAEQKEARAKAEIEVEATKRRELAKEEQEAARLRAVSASIGAQSIRQAGRVGKTGARQPSTTASKVIERPRPGAVPGLLGDQGDFLGL